MKRRYKLLIGFLVVAFFLLAIYFFTLDKKVYYLSLGDSLAAGQTPYKTISDSYGDYVAQYIDERGKLEFYTKGFTKSGYRSVDVLNDLNENKKIKVGSKELSIKHALIKADIVTVSVGANDLFYKLNIGNEFEIEKLDSVYDYIDEVMVDVDKLLFELRKSCKEQIMVFGFYNPLTSYSKTMSDIIEPMIEYGNAKMEALVNKYDMTFIDIHDTFLAHEEYLPDFLEIHPTKDGYHAMADAVINLINKKTLAK